MVVTISMYYYILPISLCWDIWSVYWFCLYPWGKTSFYVHTKLFQKNLSAYLAENHHLPLAHHNPVGRLSPSTHTHTPPLTHTHTHTPTHARTQNLRIVTATRKSPLTFTNMQLDYHNMIITSTVKRNQLLLGWFSKRTVPIFKSFLYRATLSPSPLADLLFSSSCPCFYLFSSPPSPSLGCDVIFASNGNKAKRKRSFFRFDT